jgi:hypothetical protein
MQGKTRFYLVATSRKRQRGRIKNSVLQSAGWMTN